MNVDEQYMRRALALARKGIMHASPNPMVGAVIVDADGRVIGEGYHRKCGEAHAEVNAINSVRSPQALRDSTMYVTLEPCAHHGRTGPCAQLIIDMKIPRVVVGTRDPFDKVDGRGIDMLRDAGVEVVENVLRDECQRLNVVFFTAHTLKQPFIGLKWAQTEDGFIDALRIADSAQLQISSPYTRAMAHRLRGIYDAIMVGSGTVLADNPRLDNRFWSGHQPIPVILDRRRRIGPDAEIMKHNPIIINDYESLPQLMGDLYRQGITSVLVEGGAELHRSLLSEGLWDFIRIETGPIRAAQLGSVKAPAFYGHEPARVFDFEGQSVKYYSKNSLIDVKNL